MPRRCPWPTTRRRMRPSSRFSWAGPRLIPSYPASPSRCPGAGASLADLPKSPQSEPLANAAERVARVQKFHQRLVDQGLGDTYEAAHAKLAVDFLAATLTRLKMLADKQLPLLPEVSQAAADKSYIDTVVRLCDGLEKVVAAYEKADDARKRRIFEAFAASVNGTAGTRPR